MRPAGEPDVDVDVVAFAESSLRFTPGLLVADLDLDLDRTRHLRHTAVEPIVSAAVTRSPDTS